MLETNKKNQKSSGDTWQELLCSGDLAAIMEAYPTNTEVGLNRKQHLQEIFHVIQRKAGQDIDGLIDQLFQQAIATTGCFLIRTQLNTQQALDRIQPHEINKIQSIGLVQAELDQWETQVDYLLRLAARYASIRHTLQLSKAAQSADVKTTSQTASQAATPAKITLAESQAMAMPWVEPREKVCA